MKLKGISAIAICLLSAVSALALEERITLLPGKASAGGDWLADGAVLRKGFKGGNDYVLADGAYSSGPSVDLLLHFDSASDADETGNWTLRPAKAFSLNRDKAILGTGAAGEHFVDNLPRRSSGF